MNIEELIGKTLVSVTVNTDKDQITFVENSGKKYKMYHQQDCCESVTVEDIAGDLSDLIGSPIKLAECRTSEGEVIDGKPEYRESWTWTFYVLATVKGYVTIRWLGESNGYYSEGVDFVEIGSEEDFL